MMKAIYRYALPPALFLVFLASSCKSGKQKDAGNFISVVSLIRADIADVDTSLYPILKVVTVDSLPPDTSYIKREQFRAQAADFLDLPDLSDSRVAERYRQEPARYDEQLGKVIITYLPLKPEKEETRKQELLVKPDAANGDKVTSIYVEREIANRDSLYKRRLLWQVNRSFQVITTRQYPGKPETVTVTKVSWNEPKEE